MAKAKAETELEVVDQETGEVTVASGALSEEEKAAIVARDAGLGASDAPEDSFYPLMTVLHKASPQVDEDSPAYLKGAKAGSIWLRNFEREVVPGPEGVVVQPCYMYTEWVTWTPREKGGGMVSRSLKLPEGARLVDAASNRWTDREGNDVRETRMWVVNLIHNGAAVPFVMPCQSTQNTFAKQWNTVIRQKFEPPSRGGERSSSWAYLWRITTRKRVNAWGEWFVFTFEQDAKSGHLLDANPQLYFNGEKLYKVAKATVDAGKQLSEQVDERERDDGM